MRYLGRLGRGRRVLLALAVAGAGFGIATAVQASIPGTNGIISGCYQTATGNTNKGMLRVIDRQAGEFCRYYEAPISWNALGPTGLGNVFLASGELTNTSSGTTIATVAVPPGDYAVTGSGWAAGLTAGLKDIRCYIDQPNGDALDTFLSVGLDTVDIGGQESFAVQDNVSRPVGGTITLGCLDSGGDGTILEGGQIVATTARALFGPTVAKPAGGTFKATPSH